MAPPPAVSRKSGSQAEAHQIHLPLLLFQLGEDTPGPYLQPSSSWFCCRSFLCSRDLSGTFGLVQSFFGWSHLPTKFRVICAGSDREKLEFKPYFLIDLAQKKFKVIHEQILVLKLLVLNKRLCFCLPEFSVMINWRISFNWWASMPGYSFQFNVPLPLLNEFAERAWSICPGPEKMPFFCECALLLLLREGSILSFKRWIPFF